MYCLLEELFLEEKVSVLISFYKEPLDWIKESVSSIINQTYKNIEIVAVVDDPSNTEAINYLKDISEKDFRMKIHINSENMGLVKSLNKGLEFCTGVFVARMDADDISAINRIEEQVNYINKKNLDIVGCQMFYFDAYNPENSRQMKCTQTAKACGKIVKYCTCLTHPTWLVKKCVYDKLNGYREIDACEDFDFLNRAVIEGFKIGNLPKVLFKYRYNLNSISRVKEIKQYLTMKFLSRYYRKGITPSKEQVDEYISSQEFGVDKSDYEMMHSDLNNSILNRIRLVFRNRLYRRQKCDNFKIKLWGIADSIISSSNS